MKLVLYSGGDGRENRPLLAGVTAMLQGSRSPRVSFIPSDSYHAKEDFREFKRSFSGSGVKRFDCVPVDIPLTKTEEKRILESDAIFLGGGNTFYFLQSLRERNLIRKLRIYAKSGGILMGLSAGSILMTPSIKTAEVPSFDADDNEVGLRDLDALGLVPFEFAPHYHSTKRRDDELLRYSRRIPHPIYACADGEGIIVKEGSLQFVGKVLVFHQGAKYRMQ